MAVDYPDREFELPIFPLPGLVFFSHTRVPLHIFEERYRTMISEALDSDNRIGLVLLKPGWQRSYAGNPEVYEHGTMGVIETSSRYADGRYDILLRGVVRYRIVDEISHEPYRVARVVADPEFHGSPERIPELRKSLNALAQRYLDNFPNEPDLPEIESAPFDSLVNALVMAVNLPGETKQQFLALDDLSRRASSIEEVLRERLDLVDFLRPWRSDGNPLHN